MEYYFLGEEDKEESTGYLFLEFWKEDSGEYRTIGIGQKAKRGKPMDFWGFVILDGRRVGYDLWLYKEVGSNKIPRDKREMKAELGEDNFFTDSPSEYKKHVTQYIFGFRKEEQYEQFIKLLVKVRAPKLSKEFKPTKVYDILNDSLQTLTDEELRPMVDAMEKMDEIQDLSLIHILMSSDRHTAPNAIIVEKNFSCWSVTETSIPVSEVRRTKIFTMAISTVTRWTPV